MDVEVKMLSQANAYDGPFDREFIRNQLQVAMSGEQTTIEQTNEDDTRIRAKTILSALHRIKRELDRSRAAL